MDRFGLNERKEMFLNPIEVEEKGNGKKSMNHHNRNRQYNLFLFICTGQKWYMLRQEKETHSYWNIWCTNQTTIMNDSSDGKDVRYSETNNLKQNSIKFIFLDKYA